MKTTDHKYHRFCFCFLLAQYIHVHLYFSFWFSFLLHDCHVPIFLLFSISFLSLYMLNEYVKIIKFFYVFLFWRYHQKKVSIFNFLNKLVSCISGGEKNSWKRYCYLVSSTMLWVDKNGKFNLESSPWTISWDIPCTVATC